jgi:Carbohydrate/starch-binding module (family 21)
MTARTVTLTHAPGSTQRFWPNICTKKPGMNDLLAGKNGLLSILKSTAKLGGQPIPAKSRKAHFDNIALERIRYFDQEECPRIISTIGCHADNNEIRQYIPKKDTQDWQRISITYANWTPLSIETHNLAPMVLLEMILAERPNSEDQEDTEHNDDAREDVTRLKGTVRVRNQSYHKQVSIRYTLNDWQSSGTVNGYFTRSITSLYDEFAFDLDIPLTLSSDHQATISTQVELAVQYCFNGREFWDNNSSRNYKVRGYPGPLYFVMITDTFLLLALCHTTSNGTEEAYGCVSKNDQATQFSHFVICLHHSFSSTTAACCGADQTIYRT